MAGNRYDDKAVDELLAAVARVIQSYGRESYERYLAMLNLAHVAERVRCSARPDSA
jgi:hypothetical protein